MPTLSRFLSLCRNLFRRSAVERELDAELESALETLEGRHRAAGMSPVEARRAARLALGGVEQVKEQVRDGRVGVGLESVWADVRYAWRMLRKSPAFTVAAVASLALGIGANTAIFTCLNAIVLRPLPARDPASLVDITVRRKTEGPSYVSFPMYRDIAAQQHVLSGIVATAGETPSRVTVPAATSGGSATDIDNVRVSFVTGNYFAVLGIDPAAGRLFTVDDDRNPDSAATAGSVVVLSDDFWERQFGRDRSIVGRTILIGRTRAEVIGVTPRGFVGEIVGNAADAWVPLTNWSSRDDLDNRRGTFTAFFGRLKPGIRRDQAAAELTVLFQQLLKAEGLQPRPEDHAIALESAAAGLDFSLRRTYLTPLVIIMGMVALVLLIACGNIANLLLARGAARAGELSVRLALGCSRARLARQLITESLLLSLAGAVLGFVLSRWIAHSLVQSVLQGPVRMKLNLAPDVRVFAFLAVLAIGTAVIFGLLPALRATRVDVAPALKGMRRGGVSESRQRAGRLLVVGQVAVSLLLLVGAGLLVRSFQKLQAEDLGFVPDRVVIFDLAHNPADRTPAAMSALEKAARERVLAVPGVESASFSGVLIFSPSDIGAPFAIPGEPPPVGGQPRTARYNSVTPGYFETVGLRLREGRVFQDRDNAIDAPGVVVVNESFARQFLPQRAVGRSIVFGPGAAAKTLEIVGVVGDAKYNSVRRSAKPLMFVPYAKMTRSLRSLEVKTQQPLTAIAGPVREALLGVTRDIMIRRVIPLAHQVETSLAAERLLLRLCLLFGALALVLACVGVYGVIAYSVAQRTNEIGVRIALGATPASVMRGVMRETLLLVLIGVGIGLPAAIAAGRLLTAFLYGLTPRDPATLVVATGILLAAGTLAALLPARRAAAVDPLVALRSE